MSDNLNQTQQPISTAPIGQLKTNRSFIKVILLSLITFGIYGMVTYASISNDLNVIASRYDGKKTMNYWLLIFVITPITLGIGAIVWMHKISARMGAELKRRNIDMKFGAGTFWGWNVLGAFIIVGPIIYMVKFFKAINALAADYNVRG